MEISKSFFLSVRNKSKIFFQNFWCQYDIEELKISGPKLNQEVNRIETSKGLIKLVRIYGKISNLYDPMKHKFSVSNRQTGSLLTGLSTCYKQGRRIEESINAKLS